MKRRDFNKVLAAGVAVSAMPVLASVKEENPCKGIQMRTVTLSEIADLVEFDLQLTEDVKYLINEKPSVHEFQEKLSAYLEYCRAEDDCPFENWNATINFGERTADLKLITSGGFWTASSFKI